QIRHYASPISVSTSSDPRGRAIPGLGPGCSPGAADRSRHDGGTRTIRPSNQGEPTMDTSYVAVAVVTSRTEAELIAGLLRSNGLEAAVSADDAGGQDPQGQSRGRPAGGVHVAEQVHRHQPARPGPVA